MTAERFQEQLQIAKKWLERSRLRMEYATVESVHAGGLVTMVGVDLNGNQFNEWKCVPIGNGYSTREATEARSCSPPARRPKQGASMRISDSDYEANEFVGESDSDAIGWDCYEVDDEYEGPHTSVDGWGEDLP